MELKQIGPIVLMFVLIGVLVAVGMIVFNALAYSTYYPATSNQTIAAWNWSRSQTLNYGNLTSTPIVYNTTGAILAPALYNITESSTGQVTFATVGTSNMSMTTTIRVVASNRDYNTQSNTVSASLASTIATIPNTWLGLIVTITILGFLIFIVVESFGINKQMR